jgi:hypothetical protein
MLFRQREARIVVNPDLLYADTGDAQDGAVVSSFLEISKRESVNQKAEKSHKSQDLD